MRDEAVTTSRLIVDTDTAGDDVVSLLVALDHPNLALEAITVVCGNVRFEQQVENALYTLEASGHGGEVPVYAGCAEPLVAEWVGAEYVHGRDGFGDHFFPPAKQRPEAAHAVDELVRRVNDAPGELTILAQGPLTNVALAYNRDPSVPAKVKDLYVMGGGDGNITPAAEYNFYVDPEAAKAVLNAGFPVTLFTWSLCLTHGVLDDDRVAQIERLDTANAALYLAANRRAREFERSMGIMGITHPDSMVAAAIAEPALIRAAVDAVVDVETAGELTRGWNMIDTQSRVGREPNARVVTDFDTDGFFELLLAVLEK